MPRPAIFEVKRVGRLILTELAGARCMRTDMPDAHRDGPVTNQNDFHDRPELRTDDIDYVLGYANPNATRIGCPPRDVLIALAGRERPIDDPAYEHLATCSPCYREFRDLQASCGTSCHGVESLRRR